MAVEVATLQFKADTTDLSKAEARLKRLSKAANSAEHNLDGVGKEMKATSAGAKSAVRFIGPLVAALASLGAVAKVVSVAREFDVINASLVTVTGSAEGASRAFAAIQEFAATTPFDLQQVGNAFVKLKAFGLDPSSEALLSYGNTASAMGKDLNQMIEAVADATTFEFERLKEFGIKARQETDSVSFTFRGTTKTIGKSSAEIQKFLLDIGRVEFAGAMAERANTLDGAISNLGDSIDQLFLTIAKGDKGIMNDFVRMTTSAVEGITGAIALANGTASEAAQLERINEELDVRIAAQKTITEEDKRYKFNQNEINNLLVRRAELLTSIGIAAGEAAKDEADALQERQDAALAEENRKKEEARAEDLVDAQEYMAEIMAMNDTKLEALERSEAEQITMLQDFRTQGLITEQEYQDALTEIMRNGHAERKDIRLQDLEDLHAENDALMEGIIEQDEKRKEQADQTTQTLLAFEDILMKGKSEKEKMAFRTAVNLANAEKRENAKSIISNSYDAAMKAYKSLAGIPLIGPALGAAAAATILAAGVSFAAQSLSGRALGGQVRAGESYVVGERGPEVLTMGGMGNITPNSALGQGSSGVVNKTANVNFNITANDSQGFDELLVNRRGLIINIINDAIEDQGRAAII
jgi:hypothetical protein